jgi:hypothetical protein
MATDVMGEAKLGEKTIAFRFRTFRELELKTGKKTPELLESMAVGLGFSELTDFVAAGLRLHHPEMTEADVDQLLDEVGYNAAGLAVCQAVSGFFGKQREKDQNPRKAA